METMMNKNAQYINMQNLRVGYAYVPSQRLSRVYQPKKALMEGTIFPELNIQIGEYERGLYDGK